MSDEVRERKAGLRAALLARRAALPEAEVRAASEAVCRHVAALPAFARARLVTLYAATRGEIDPAALDPLCRANGAGVAWPRVAATTPPTLAFHLAAPAELLTGTFAVRAPPASAPVAKLEELELIIVPGLAFDQGGHRLGYGRGFYDAAMRAAPRALRIAIGHSFQLVGDLPRAEHDEPVDAIVTPEGARETFARRGFGQR
jgi:5-formyltetrahydrofolate cyclo-ligase